MLKAIIYSIVGFLFLFITALFTLTSPITRWAFAELFSEHSLSLSDSSNVAINPFNGELSISDLAIVSKEHGDLLQLDNFHVQVELASLFSTTYIVKVIKLSGFKLHTEKSENDSFLIGGFDLAKLTANAPQEPATETSNTEQVPTEDLNVVVENITLSNIDLKYKDSAHSIAALLTTFSINELRFTQSINGNIDLALPIDMSSNIQYKGLINDVNFGSDFNLTAPITLSLEQETKNVAVNFPTLSIELLKASMSSSKQDVLVGFDHFLTQFTNLTVSISEHSQSALEVKGALNLKLENFLAQNHQSDKTFADLKNLNVAKTQFQIAQNDLSMDYKTSGESISVVGFKSMFITEDEQSSLLNVKDITVNDWQFNPELASVQEINIGKVTTNIIIGKDKNILNLYLPEVEALTEDNTTNQANGAAQQVSDEQSQNNDTQSVAASPKIQIVHVHNNDTLEFNTLDLSVVPNFSSKLAIDKLVLRDFDSVNTDYITTLDLQATNNDYAKISIDAKSQLFSKKPWHEFTVKLDEIDLVSVSPYVSSALGYHITNGQLDSDITGNIRNNIIDGTAKLFMRSIDLEALKETGEKQAFDSGAISFNYALGMLKDGDGNVELEVPFEGDLNNPSVGFSGFLSLIVKRATMSAAKDYLINTFVPYANIVSFAVSAGQEALKMRFTDFVFASKQRELSDDQIKTLVKLSEVLNKYPGVSVRLCPISTPNDLDDDKLSDLDPDEIQELRNLALYRAGIVKQYLVTEKGIASKRLLACNPSIDYDKEAKGRIELKHL